MFRNLIWCLAALMLALAAMPASAALNVLASVPEWAALAKEIGGERVSVSSATNALQDPHRVDAKPSLIARARGAQLVIATGAGLEVGWLPVVLRESGNAGIQPGQPGYLEAAGLVRLLEVPTRVDRADGDVHPGGNPHLQLDPRNVQKVADALAARLAQLDPAGAALSFHEGVCGKVLQRRPFPPDAGQDVHRAHHIAFRGRGKAEGEGLVLVHTPGGLDGFP